MDAPQYLWDLLDRELRKSHIALLQKVATKYNLDFDKLEAELLPPVAKLVSNKETPIEIRRKARPKGEAPEDDRCCARIYNRGKGGRCSRTKQEGCDYCKQHVKDRKHGDIRQEVPRDIFPKQKQLLFV